MNSEAAPSSAGAAAAAVLPEEPVSLVVEEKLAVVLNKDGGLDSMEVQGTMSLQVSVWGRRRRAAVQSMEGACEHASARCHQRGCYCLLSALSMEVQGTMRLSVRQGVLAGQCSVMQGVESAGSEGL